ncbi:hypothetical protein RI054_16g77170 [Pseudoscourfieldia marina]
MPWQQYLASIACTSSIVLINKAILERFSFVTGNFLIPLHFTILNVINIRRFLKRKLTVKLRYVLIAAFLALLNFGSTNAVLKLSTVSFQQISRLLTIPAGVFVDAYFWSVPLPTTRRLVYICGMIFSAGTVLYEKQKVSPLAAVASLVVVATQVGSQMIAKYSCRTCNATSEEFVQDCAFPMLLMAVATSTITAMSRKTSDDEVSSLDEIRGMSTDTAGLIALSCLIAVLVNYLAAYLSEKCTGLSYALLTLSKTMCAVLAGMLIYGETFEGTTFWASLSTFALFALYTLDESKLVSS